MAVVNVSGRHSKDHPDTRRMALLVGSAEDHGDRQMDHHHLARLCRRMDANQRLEEEPVGHPSAVAGERMVVCDEDREQKN